MQNHRQHADLRDLQVNRRADQILSIALAIFIGTGLAVALVLGWCG